MRILKILVIILIIGSGAYWWKAHYGSPAGSSPNGFVSAAMPDNAKANTVMIVAPLNCPSEEGQRANALSSELRRLDIPNVIIDSFSVDPQNATDEEKIKIERAFKILNEKIPAVFINGMAKANPSAAEVKAEYERTK